jgi:hypothetical protein
MKSLHTRLARLAAITCIGLAGSAFAVLAQAPGPTAPGGPVATNGPVTPPPFKCEAGEMAFKDGNGTADNFAGTADPPTHPSAAFAMSSVLLNATTNKYDQTASNYHFGETFTLNQPGITKIRLTTRLKWNSGDANNDGISFSAKTGFTPGHFGFGLGTGVGGPLVPGWGTSSQPPTTFTFEFDPAGTQIHVNTVGITVPGYSGATFYSDLNSNHVLHMFVQDDTSVDFIQIEGCYKPAPKYDLVASKKHDGNVYLLNVHNAGSQIMPTGHVDVVEVVPAGLTITSFPTTPPWVCTGLLPVVGPDSFTCSYQIPSGGIAANSNLPQIILKSEGTPECENCMRVKLYLKDFAEGVKPVDEGDMKNNVSCAN